MKRALVLCVAAALCASLPGSSLARQGRVVETLPKPRAKPQPAPESRAPGAPASGIAPPSPETARQRYAERLDGAATCDEFMAVATGVNDVRPILISAAKQTKGEFETSEEFIKRYTSGIASALGGANILAVRIPLSSSSLAYDADQGRFLVSATNVNSAVDSIACDQVYCRTTLGSVGWELGAYGSTSLSFDVPREDAVAVKNAPSLVIGFPLQKLTVAKKSYVEGFEVTINQRCALLLSGDKVYPATSSFWFNRQLPAMTRGPTPVVARGDIIETLKASGQFKTLLRALDKASLTALIKAQRTVTVFAPTDDAFAGMPAGELDRLMSDPAALQRLLVYHIINQPIDSSSIVGTKLRVTTIAGKDLLLDGSGGVLKANDTNIVLADVKTPGGVIFVIDAVLTP